MNPLAADATDWISAVSTAGLGLLGVAVSLWQWHASGFRPRFESWVDQTRRRIQLHVGNRGRAPGVIQEVHVVVNLDTPEEEAVDIAVNGFAGDVFLPTELPGLASMSLIITAAGETDFPMEAGLLIVWGGGKTTRLELEQLKDGSFAGLRSRLPPGAANAEAIPADANPPAAPRATGP